MVFCVATVMDPRFKILAIESCLSVYDLWESDIELKVIQVKSLLSQVYEVYRRSYAAAITNSLPATDSMASSDFVGSNSIDVNIPVVGSSSMTRFGKGRISSTSVTSDLQMYLDHDNVDVAETDTFNDLSWWKTNSCMYPIFSCDGKRHFERTCIHCGVRSCFSAGGRVVSEKHVSFSLNHIQALACLKDSSLAKTRSQDAAAEEATAEELMNVKASRPEWLISDEEMIESAVCNLAEADDEE